MTLLAISILPSSLKKSKPTEKGNTNMDKDLETALKCIRMVAQYSLDERESRDEMASTLAYIIEEVTEALAKAKGTAS